MVERRPIDEEVQAALAALEEMSTPHDRENLARFGITASKAFGVSMANLQVLAKRLGRDHELAAALRGPHVDLVSTPPRWKWPGAWRPPRRPRRAGWERTHSGIS
jgi:hypothetical protein